MRLTNKCNLGRTCPRDDARSASCASPDGTRLTRPRACLRWRWIGFLAMYTIRWRNSRGPVACRSPRHPSIINHRHPWALGGKRRRRGVISCSEHGRCGRPGCQLREPRRKHGRIPRAFRLAEPVDVMDKYDTTAPLFHLPVLSAAASLQVTIIGDRWARGPRLPLSLSPRSPCGHFYIDGYFPQVASVPQIAPECNCMQKPGVDSPAYLHCVAVQCIKQAIPGWSQHGKAAEHHGPGHGRRTRDRAATSSGKTVVLAGLVLRAATSCATG
ncbi:hypothetical protein B0I35DRAFT_51611 [Stachybotrys elegans]|uniref:Uncharacterized protein n=1 Tax=Stachybotrys elegans TaxID=80388 RepID=A0A8K0SJP2_9HYPO|nr:hypothetical protein B0I35DRAFT_51611 [Stachybotrys elegans]